MSHIIFVVDETNEHAMSLVKKLQNVRPGTIIPLTRDEYIAAQDGSLHPIDIGDLNVTSN